MDHTQDILELARRNMAARRAAADAARLERPDQRWLYAFIGLGLTLLAGLLLLPIGGLDERLQMVVHGVCAQAHYLHVGDLRMPLCARNTGIYAGVLATILFLGATGRFQAAKLPSLPITLLLLLGAMAMVVDGFNSMLLDLGGYNVYQPLNILRVITGLLMGNAIGTFMVLMFNISLRRAPRKDQRIIASPLAYLGLLLVNAAVYLAIFFGPPLLYYPLALFSVVGIAGVLFAANIFVLAMVAGMENRVARLRQLVRPATIALLLTGVELAALAGLRMWVEHASTMPM